MDTPTPDLSASDSLMTISEILAQLQRVPDQADFAPYEKALRAALAQRDAITPELIAAIDRVSADPSRYVEDAEACLHLFAFNLLAEFQDRRALDSFLRFFSLPGELSLDLTGDMVTESGAVLLASVCGGDPEPLLKLIHNEAVSEYVRCQALDGLLVQAAWDQRPREAVVEELRRLFHTLPKPGNAFLWARLGCAICDFHAPELAPELRQAFAEELVDENVLDLASMETELGGSGKDNFVTFRESQLPMDTVAECSSWLCFREDADDDGPRDAIEDLGSWEPKPFPSLPKPTPYVAPSKVGRNDSCPCGSGKKFKKCCGR